MNYGMVLTILGCIVSIDSFFYNWPPFPLQNHNPLSLVFVGPNHCSHWYYSPASCSEHHWSLNDLDKHSTRCTEEEAFSWSWNENSTRQVVFCYCFMFYFIYIYTLKNNFNIRLQVRFNLKIFNFDKFKEI